MTLVLRRGIGSWSAGTRVEVTNWFGSPHPFNPSEGMVEVRVLAGDKPLIEIAEEDVIERRSGIRIPKPEDAD